MTIETTHELITSLFDGDNRNTRRRVLGEYMRDLRKSDLVTTCKQQHGTTFKSALKS